MIVWTTKDGTKIPLHEMSTDHLKNCLKMMQSKRSDVEVAYCVADDVGTFLGKVECEELLVKYTKTIAFLKRELNRRSVCIISQCDKCGVIDPRDDHDCDPQYQQHLQEMRDNEYK